MSNSTGPLYEFTYVVAAGIREEFEIWLRDFQKRSLLEADIEDARGYEAEADDDGFLRFVFRYRATDDHAMDRLLDGHFNDADGELAEKFGDGVSTQSRILREDRSREIPSTDNPNCLNCGTRLRGQYCGHCGQRSRNRLISIWQLLREAFGDLLELDSRLWRTLLPLLIRPGQLTRDYLEGRRARYMPPFRTYLVLSIIFFVVAFFNPRDELKMFFEPEPEPTAEEIADLAEKKQQASDVDDDEFFGDCEKATISDEEDMPEWVKKRFTDDRVKEICEKNKARGNKNLSDAILDNVPIALIVLLPLMAMVLKVLYPLSRRYFVEHLLFFVHFHAFFFLMLIVQILFARLTGFLGPEDSIVDNIRSLILVVASLYIPVYLYKAMRHVYGQGHLITIPKYLLLSIAYVIGATLTMVSAFLFAVLSA